jgi:ComF family protein
VRAALLELIAPSVCPACDAPRRPGERLLCAACARGLRRMPTLRGVATALAYEDTAARLLRRYKFEARRDALPLLVAALADRLAEVRIDVVVPVPRHRARIREQGGDPVHDLARALARYRGLPLCDALRRTRATPPQTGLGPAQRRENVRGSFRASGGALRRRRVLLLDDVTTTGATLAEARRALAALGRGRPRGVLRAALAATPPHAL